jgi:hypothetical protein
VSGALKTGFLKKPLGVRTGAEKELVVAEFESSYVVRSTSEFMYQRQRSAVFFPEIRPELHD